MEEGVREEGVTEDDVREIGCIYVCEGDAGDYVRIT